VRATKNTGVVPVLALALDLEDLPEVPRVPGRVTAPIVVEVDEDVLA
jgi:hypothetical protein